MKPARIEALSDGIFAIVMTLLVLELHVPTVEVYQAGTVSSELLQALGLLWPKFLSFVVSFILIGIYWTGHHIQFGFVKKANFNFIWLNMLFLLLISVIPFSTALLGEYPFAQISIIIYGLNLISAGLLLYGNWRYARTRDLIDASAISSELRRNARQKILLPPFMYFMAILASFVNTKVSLVLFILGPIVYFIPVTTRLWDTITDPLGRHRDTTTG